jgi:hypothetical protein
MKKHHYLLLLQILLFISCRKEIIPTYILSTSTSPTEGGIIKISPQSTSYSEGDVVTLTPEPNENWVFQKWQGDATGNTTPLQITMNSNKSVTGVFVKKEVLDFELIDLKKEYSITDSVLFILKPILSDGSSGNIVQNGFTYKIISGEKNVSYLNSSGFICTKSGIVKIEISFANKIKTIEIKILKYKVDEIDPFLKTPVLNYSKLVPVVIINYYPTKDGVNVDQTSYPIRDYADAIVQNCKLSELKKWVINNDIKTKFVIEEGTKYKGYLNANVNPYIGIKVIKQVTFYEIDKIVNPDSKDGEEGYFPDYNSVFDEIGLKDLVESQGVKEVWFNSKSLSIPESNMSSPTSGDISNSTKTDDLPVYSKTYVVYGNFIHRWYAENIHNRGHQIEAQLAHLDFTFGGASTNNSLFWNDFVGFKRNGSAYNKEGRVGATHFTPNSEGDYDYNNTSVVSSDINDWNPDNSGKKIMVNNSTWVYERKFNAVLPQVNQIQRFKDLSGKAIVGQDPQGGWLLFWFQSIPSKNSGIPYKTGVISNWWDLFYDWDDAIRNKKKLWN